MAQVATTEHVAAWRRVIAEQAQVYYSRATRTCAARGSTFYPVSKLYKPLRCRDLRFFSVWTLTRAYGSEIRNAAMIFFCRGLEAESRET